MNTFISQLMREYFCKSGRQPEANRKFVKFEPEDQPNLPIGAHSNGVAGRIWYTEDQQVRQSPRLFVKFLSAEDQKVWPGSPIYWFHTEIHFYTKVAPFLDSFRSIRHLIPHFLHAKEDAGKVALLFDHLEPLGFANANREWGLDYAHLSLMARRIGEFHAYSLAAHKVAPGQLQQVAALPVDSYASLATAQQDVTVQTLRRALQSLGRDPQFAAATPRVEEILANFVDSVMRAFSASSLGAVLCHRSYSQSNVMFRYAGGAPVDLVIVDWQTMAFASLGVDLGLVLYLEAGQSTRDQHWHRLLDDYRESLGQTFGRCDVSLPSEQQILQELRISAAATLNMLAYKVHQEQAKSDSHDFDGTNVNDRVIIEVLKDMIRRNLL